jgi:hypothetical protein
MKSIKGVRLLQSLFVETHRGGVAGPFYTLKDEDYAGYPSLYRLYIDTEDPTEYTFANTHLSGWEHWEMLCKCKWFQKYLERWRKELELKIKSKAIAKLRELSDDGGPQALQAAKLLLDYDKHLEKKTKNRVGRPTKEKDASPVFDLDDAFKRVIGAGQDRVN